MHVGKRIIALQTELSVQLQEKSSLIPGIFLVRGNDPSMRLEINSANIRTL